MSYRKEPEDTVLADEEVTDCKLCEYRYQPFEGFLGCRHPEVVAQINRPYEDGAIAVIEGGLFSGKRRLHPVRLKVVNGFCTSYKPSHGVRFLRWLGHGPRVRYHKPAKWGWVWRLMEAAKKTTKSPEELGYYSEVYKVQLAAAQSDDWVGIDY